MRATRLEQERMFRHRETKYFSISRLTANRMDWLISRVKTKGNSRFHFSRMHRYSERMKSGPRPCLSTRAVLFQYIIFETASHRGNWTHYGAHLIAAIPDNFINIRFNESCVKQTVHWPQDAMQTQTHFNSCHLEDFREFFVSLIQLILPTAKKKLRKN